MERSPQESRLAELEKTLYRLIFHQSFRAHFLSGDWNQLGVSQKTQDSLQTLDKGQLKKTASRVTQNILSGAVKGEGGLRASFPKTLANWQTVYPQDVHLESLMGSFQESQSFDRYRELPYGGKGICLEEAFYLFLADHEFLKKFQDFAFILREEFFTSLMKGLIFCPSPNFEIECEDIIEIPNGFYATQVQWPHFVLYAAVNGKYINGPITPLIAEILKQEASGHFLRACPKLSKQFNLSQENIYTVFNQLAKLGLVQATPDAE